MGDAPQERPAEQKEVTKEQLYAIIEAMHKAADDVRKYDIKGSSPGMTGVRHEEGDFAYVINLNTYGDNGSFSISKDRKKIFGSDEHIGVIFIQTEKLEKGGFNIEMKYQQRDGKMMKLQGGGTERVMGEAKVIATAEYKDGKYAVNNGGLIKEKTDKFLKIFVDYVNARKPKITGPQEVRDF